MAGPAIVLAQAASAPRIAFDRHEPSGAVVDLGTDHPLVVGMVVAGGLDPASTFLVLGAFQMLTGLTYRLPMHQLRGGAAWRTLRHDDL